MPLWTSARSLLTSSVFVLAVPVLLQALQCSVFVLAVPVCLQALQCVHWFVRRGQPFAACTFCL